MPVLRNIRVWSMQRDAINISWEIAETTEDLSQFQVYVLRSTAEFGPYDVISPALPAADIYEFQDRGANQISKWRDFYYRLRLVESGSGDTVEFGSVPNDLVVRTGADPGGVAMSAVPDLEALESTARFNLVAQEYAGRRVLFLPLRTFGQRCSVCWDALKRRVSRSDCPTCFRTGFSGGYLYPRVGYIISVPSQQMNALTSLLTLEPHDVVRWVPPSPRLSPGDLMADTENRRWRVITIQNHEKSQALTWQTVQFRELSRDQIEYKIPLNWDEDNVSVAPHRQFIRATDIDSYRSAAQDSGFGEVTPNQIKGFRTNIDEEQ